MTQAICEALVNFAATMFDIYFGFVSYSTDNSYITGAFSTLFGTTDVWNMVRDVHQSVVVPLAESLLALFMLIQLVKISQRMDATGTLPAVKDIVMLAVFYVIFHWLISNSLDIVSAIFDEFNKMAVSLGSPTTAGGFKAMLDTDNLTDNMSIGSCFALAFFSILSVAVGVIAFVVTIVVAAARAVQLYVMAAFSPVPLALLGFDETRQMGIGFLKNFCAAALAGAIIMFLLMAYPLILTSTISATGADHALDFTDLITGQANADAFMGLLTFVGISLLLVMGLVKSGSWAKDILGG